MENAIMEALAQPRAYQELFQESIEEAVHTRSLKDGLKVSRVATSRAVQLIITFHKEFLTLGTRGIFVNDEALEGAFELFVPIAQSHNVSPEFVMRVAWIWYRYFHDFIHKSKERLEDLNRIFKLLTTGQDHTALAMELAERYTPFIVEGMITAGYTLMLRRAHGPKAPQYKDGFSTESISGVQERQRVKNSVAGSTINDYFKMRLEIHFHEQKRASVCLETTATGELEKYGELLLFALFALREMVNLGLDQISDSLATVLAKITPLHLIGLAGMKFSEAVDIIDYPGFCGRKVFTVLFHSEGNRIGFEIPAEGFGLLGEEGGYYAPAAVIVLLRYLTKKRADDSDYLSKLANSASGCGVAQVDRILTFANQAALAMMNAKMSYTGNTLSEDDLRDITWKCTISLPEMGS